MNFQLARTNMISQQIKPWQVSNEHILDVLSQVARENFVSPVYAHLAYSDTELPLDEGQTLLAPKIVAKALQTLALTGDEKVLEVGSGTGYVTACLSHLAKSIISIEIYPHLLHQAEKILSSMNCCNLTLEQGDGVYGWEAYAPYDAIIVTGSYPLGVPQKICEQLNIKGRLFAICGLAPRMQALRIERLSIQDYRTTVLFETVAPALIHAPHPPTFQF